MLKRMMISTAIALCSILSIDAHANEESYKPGTGFVSQTDDGKFSIAVRTRIQFRDELKIQGDEEIENVFGIRRARLQFKGHVWGDTNKYKAEFAFSPRDLGRKPDGSPVYTPLLTWYYENTAWNDLSIRIGQYKLHYSRQRVISSGDLEFVDRSLAQGEFNVDRDIGFNFFSNDLGSVGLFRYYAGLTIAEGRDNWESEDVKGPVNSYQAFGRFEFLPFGMFKDYSEVDFTRSNKLRLSLGVATSHLENGAREKGYLGKTWADGGTVNYDSYTADAMLKYLGFSLFGELFERNGKRLPGQNVDEDNNLIEATNPRNGVGATIQLGYFFAFAPVNVGFRYSVTGRGDNERDETSIDVNSEHGATIGYYPGGHPFKIQADYFRLKGDSYSIDEDRLRLQLQIAY